MNSADCSDEFPYDSDFYEGLWRGGLTSDADAELIEFLDRGRERETARAERRRIAARRSQGELVWFGSGPRHGLVPLIGQACPMCAARDTWYSTHEQHGEFVGFDARFCMECDRWLESDGGWWTAAGERRPDRPSGVPFDNLVLADADEAFY